jgi:two-component system, NarL family, sensor kinase
MNKTLPYLLPVLLFLMNSKQDACAESRFSNLKQLYDSSWKYMNSGDTTLSHKYCDLYLKNALDSGNLYGIGDAYRSYANYYLISNNYSKSIECYKNSLEYSRKLKGKKGELLYAECLLNFGLVYHRNGDFKIALEYYLPAEKIYDTYKDYFGLSDTYNRMADIYMSLGQKGKAMAYNKKAFDYGLKSKEKYIMLKSYFCYASNLGMVDSFEQANRYYLKALQIAHETGHKTFESDTYYNMAGLLEDRGQYKEALPLYRKSYEIARQTGEMVNIGEILRKIGKIHFLLNDLTEARKELTEVLNISRQAEYMEMEKDALLDLSDLEHKAGNYAKAYEYLKNSIEITEKIYSEEDQEQINYLNGKYQAEKRETEIYRLESEKKLQSAKILRKNIILMATSALLVLILIVAYLWIRHYKQRKQIADQEVELHKHTIKELEHEKMLLATQSVLKGEELERKRIARDLHDGLGGLLTGVKSALSNAKGNMVIDQEGVQDFNRAIEILNSSIVELRRVAHNMMPEALVKFGLKDTLKDFCNELSKVNRMQIVFQFFGQFERVDSNMEINSYRILQELVNNALKHSEATEMIIQMIQEPRRLCFIVFDNGKGFDAGLLQTSKGNGLAGIRSRVESFNGNLEISSNTGKGTEITVEFMI